MTLFFTLSNLTLDDAWIYTIKYYKRNFNFKLDISLIVYAYKYIIGVKLLEHMVLHLNLILIRKKVVRNKHKKLRLGDFTHNLHFLSRIINYVYNSYTYFLQCIFLNLRRKKSYLNQTLKYVLWGRIYIIYINSSTALRSS